MSTRHATGHVRVIARKGGPVLYAKLKLPDGTEPQRKLGRLWTKRSNPPAGYLTRRQAEARLAAILSGDDPMLNLTPSHVTVGEACDEWLRYVEHDKQRAKSTVRDYRNTTNAVIKPALGESTPVEDVTTLDVDALRDKLLAGKLSRRTTQKIMVMVHGILARAKRKGWIPFNPAEDTEKVTIEDSDEFNILEPEQVAAISRAATDATMGALFTVGAFTGLPCPGELTALRWAHVDFANRIVHVQRNYVLGAEGRTKGKRVRSVPLSDQALVALDVLSRREHFTAPDDLVFCTQVGERLTGDAIRDAFYDAVDDAKLGHLRLKDDPIVPYDLRHTFGTLAVRKASLTDVQAWMGHKDVTTTMRYVHYVPQHDAAAKLTAAFGGERVPPDVPRTADMAVQLSETDHTENG
jgi:integrase